MRDVRAIVFDLFDKLVDLHFARLPATEVAGRKIPATLSFQHEAILARGHEVDFETFVATLRASDRDLSASHLEKGIELPTTLRFERLVERLEIDDVALPEILTQTHMGKIREVADTPAHHAEVLADLGTRYRVGLCSNFSHTETALRILDAASLRMHFDAVAVSEAVGVRKPRPEIFRHVLEALGVAPEETVHVGDNLDADVRGATEVGMRTIWVDRRVRDKERALREYEGPAPTWTISDLSSIAGVLR